MRAHKPQSLWALSAAAALGYVVISRYVSASGTSHLDAETRETLQRSRQSMGEFAASATNPLGKEWLHLPAAMVLTLYLARHGSERRAFLPTVASLTAELLSRTLDRLPPHRRPPAGHPKPYKPSFPSGHALETTAVAGTSAYIIARENLAPGPLAFGTAAALTLTSTFGRLYLDRHWATDAIAGASMGVAVAAACGAIYETSAS